LRDTLSSYSESCTRILLDGAARAASTVEKGQVRLTRNNSSGGILTDWDDCGSLLNGDAGDKGVGVGVGGLLRLWSGNRETLGLFAHWS
jgi:hypothetical protein